MTISAGSQRTIKAWLEKAIAGAPAPKAPSEPRAPAPIPWQPPLVQQKFFDTVAKLKPEQQVEAVRKKLQEVNPGFDGTVQHKIEDDSAVEFSFITDEITDIWPVRALVDLKTLRCNGTGLGEGQLTDLAPLEGMKLT